MGLFLLSSSYAESQWRDRQGNTVKKAKSMNDRNGFGVNMVSVNEKNFFKAWNVPSKTVRINEIEKIHKGGALIFPIIFGGCKVNKDEQCNIRGDFLIVAPDGSIYTDVKNMLIFHGKPQPNYGLNVSGNYIKVVIERKDLLGEYHVKAQITDTIQKIHLNVEKSFKVVDDNISIKEKKKKPEESTKPTKEDIDASRWMTYAYKHGFKDDKDKILFMLHSRLFTDNKSSLVIMAIFMSERFKQYDTYLVQEKNKFLDLKDNNALEVLLFALKQADTKNANILYDALIKKVKDTNLLHYIQNLKPLHLLELEIKKPVTIDMLWASFMATGKKEYVEKIIGILAREEKGVSNILLIGSAKWSLSSNIQQHEKVFDICKNFKTKDKNIKKRLKEILQHSKVPKE